MERFNMSKFFLPEGISCVWTSYLGKSATNSAVEFVVTVVVKRFADDVIACRGLAMVEIPGDNASRHKAKSLAWRHVNSASDSGRDVVAAVNDSTGAIPEHFAAYKLPKPEKFGQWDVVLTEEEARKLMLDIRSKDNRHGDAPDSVLLEAAHQLNAALDRTKASAVQVSRTAPVPPSPGETAAPAPAPKPHPAAPAPTVQAPKPAPKPLPAIPPTRAPIAQAPKPHPAAPAPAVKAPPAPAASCDWMTWAEALGAGKEPFLDMMVCLETASAAVQALAATEQAPSKTFDMKLANGFTITLTKDVVLKGVQEDAKSKLYDLKRALQATAEVL